ncbi:MAG: lamin tail domain-containing protein [Candidatus Thiodiazotropha sp. (ex Epidulcina cf. delphinae)]|nr:lamin tail domain-containing protein [Candidatus Thiodiazotropha sp. (ex Epidulcina cf. delphinae)]
MRPRISDAWALFAVDPVGRKGLDSLGNIAIKLAVHANAVISGRNGPASKCSEDSSLFSIESNAAVEAFQPFQVGSLGNFPYYWQNPGNLKFNEKTYHWVSAGLKANASPVQLAQPFTNLYISALSKVSYSLSNTDQAKLSQAQRDVTDQQGALLKAWQAAYGTVPAGTGGLEPIDIIINQITQTWASPPTTLEQLQQAHDINSVLNKTPASGKPILPALVNYLNALQSSISLVNATTMNSGYLQQALAAVQGPNAENGALETSDGRMRPAYDVSTPLEDILDGLNSTDKTKAFTLKMSIVRSSPTEYSVDMNDGRTDKVPIVDFLSIETDDGADLFQDKIVTGSDPAEIDATFMGVTTVYFGPVYFSKAAMENWYWISPIKDAMKNDGKDVSGFKFSPNPQIDFTKSGAFAFLTGVVISKKVSLTITSKSANYKTIAHTIQALPSANLKFLGMPMGSATGDSSKHKAIVTTNDEDASVVINFEPSSELVGDSLESTAFVLGVQTNYPTAEEKREL